MPWQRREFPSQAAGSSPCQASGCQDLLSASGEQRWTQSDPRAGPFLAREPGESIPSPGRCVCARRGAGAAEGAGARPSAAFFRGLGGAERSSAAQRSAAGPFPAAAVRPMAQSRLQPAPLGRGCRSQDDARGTAGGWNEAPYPSTPTARVLLPPKPEATLAWQSLGGGAVLVPPSPLGLQLTPLQLFPNAPGTGTCSPTPPSTGFAVGNLGKGGVRRGGWLAPSPRIREANSPANRQSFSALDFWITTSISF